MFSKAPKRKGNLTGSGKKININQVAQSRFTSKKRVHGIYAHRLPAQIQSVIFVTIDSTLANVTIDSPISAKAQAAKKMFSAYKG